MLSILLALVAAQDDYHPRCDINGSASAANNVLVGNCEGDVCDVVSIKSDGRLPLLPDGAELIKKGAADDASCYYDGTVVFAGPLSLDPTDLFYTNSKRMRRSLGILADIVNDRGGLRVGGKRLAIHCRWYGDGSDVERVTNATAFASRDEPEAAHFLMGPYSSSLSKYAVQQAAAEGKIMIAPAAATPSVINGSQLAFGVLPPGDQMVRSVALGVAQAAMACDALDGDGSLPDSNPCSTARRATRCARGGGSCRASLLVGLVYEELTFPESTCRGVVAHLEALGIEYAKASDGSPLMSTLPSIGTAADVSDEQALAMGESVTQPAGKSASQYHPDWAS